MNHRIIPGVVVALLLAAIFAGPVDAQRAGGWTWNMKYSTVLGTGETADYTGGFSWRGVTFDLERGVNENFTVGLTTGWHVMDDRAAGTQQFPSGAITGTAFRYVNSAPILLTGNYFFGHRGEPRPYLGFGAGTYWIENRTEAGVFYVDDDNWHFGALGEAGVEFQRPGGAAFTISARYNWAFEANDIERQYLTFSVGYSIGN